LGRAVLAFSFNLPVVDGVGGKECDMVGRKYISSVITAILFGDAKNTFSQENAGVDA
jgi:hypothetical protein